MSPTPAFPPERSGVYGVASDASLRQDPRLAGAEWLNADLAAVRDKTGLLRALAAAVRFPGAFGANWDALADVLQDLSWRPANAYVLHLSNAVGARRALGEDWRTFVEILFATAMYWKARDKAFVALVEGAQGLTQWA